MAVAKVYNTVVDNRPPLVFANPACARARSLRVGIVRYEGDLQLDPDAYDDPQGYYITHQTCCRNGGVDNIRNPDRAGYTFYLEFPPLKKNGRLFVNSSPIFGTANGEYVCRGEPFTMSFAARDPDGDQVRYSLVTPFERVNTTSQGTFPGPYPEVGWLPGFSASRAFGPSSSLTIHPQTGELSLTAAALGLFVFAVNVEEFRGGEKIGEVRRDYQLLVVDCPPITPLNPVVEIGNQPPGTTEARLCEGQAITMRATANASWAYQWTKDGSNLPGATDPALTVEQAGVYQLITSLRNECSRSQRSRTVTLTTTPTRVPLRVRGKPYLCGSADQVELSTPSGATPSFTWYRNGTELLNDRTSVLIVRQPGHYSAVSKDASTGCVSKSDTIRVQALALPVAEILPPASSEICQGDSLRLTATGGVEYRWQRENTPIVGKTQAELWVKEAGNYSVSVTDTAGCRATETPPFVLHVLETVAVLMDSLPNVCGLNEASLPLHGYPGGGSFAGPGVVNNLFYPQKAGWGKHRLTYTVTSFFSCRSGTAERTVAVAPSPTVRLPRELTTWKGASLVLRPLLSGEPAQFEWQPPQAVVVPNVSQTRTVALENDELFTLSVTNEAGCKAQASVQVHVYQRIWVPDVFTPNGDGVNDVLELKGIEEYPGAEVTIYNRWGEIVYHTEGGYTKPFDGRWRGEALPPGNYAYTIRPSEERPLLRGFIYLSR